MAMTVLSQFTAGSFDQAQLLSQMQQTFQQNAQKKTDAINNSYNADINSVNMTSDRWKTVRTGIQEGRSVVSNNLARAKQVLSALDSMIMSVNKAGNSEDGYASAYASAFDSYLSGLDRTAGTTNTEPNLLGEAKKTLTYRVGINGTTTTVNSAFIGSDYYIIDSEGKYWDVNRTSKIIKRYDTYPDEPTSIAGNFETGLQLDSISGDDVTFTVGANTATPQTFSGTIHRKGLHVLDSWAYDGLATAAGRQRALDDLKDAKTAVQLEIRRYNVAFTTSDFYDSVASQSITGLRKKTNQMMIEQATAISEEQNKLAREFQMASSAVTQSIAVQNQYAKMLNPLFSGSTTKSLISIFA